MVTLRSVNRNLCMLHSGPSSCELRGFQCRPDGSFLPLQCDVTSCWCVSEDGQEVSRTRVSRQTGLTPSCDRRCRLLVVVTGTAGSCDEAADWLLLCSSGPVCPAPTVTHGALVCHPVAAGRQSCDLICHRGYQNSFQVSSFLCDTESLRWEGDKPLGGACQCKRAER